MAFTIDLTGLGNTNTYTQNFNTLSNTAATTNVLSITGWLLTESGGGARDNEQYAVDAGSSTTGDIYSYGAAASTDRALGALRSGTLIPVFGAVFSNSTGSTIESFDISYTGEQWRLGTTGRTDRIDFQYSLNATDLTNGTWTDFDALDFTTPDTVTTGAKNGNAAADRTALSSTISGLSLAAGATFMIRWSDLDATGADDGLAIDDFSLTANGAAPVVNLAPTLTSFIAPVATALEDTQQAITFANLIAQGDEADIDGTVTSFVVKAVTTGSLKIGTSAGSATAFNASTNNTIDATHIAFWTPAANANGAALGAFTAVARDDGGLESAAPVQVTVAVTAVNDAPTFASSTPGTGKIVTDINSATDDVSRSVTMQADGKIVVAGYSDNGSSSDFAVVRYNADGSLDTSFNGTGKLVTDIGSSSDDQGNSVTVQADGKIVVAGYSNNGGSTNFAVVRYNANGSLDTSFNSTGKLVTDIGSSSGDIGRSVTVQADGKIVVAGYTDSDGSYDFAVVRYNANGSLDTSFNGTGKVVTDIGSATNEQGYSVAVQADGKIVVAGYSDSGSNPDFAVVRYNVNGSLDTSFNGTGKVVTSIGSFTFDIGQSVTVQVDGKIVVAGNTSSGGSDNIGVVRYNTDGSLDTSFNGTGKLVTDIGSGTYDEGRSVTVQADGKIVVAGYSESGGSPNFTVVRYNANGSLDTSFNGTGKLVTDIGSSTGDVGQSVTVQADGKIVVAGNTLIGGFFDFAVVRYNTDGSLDTSFGAVASNTLGGTVAYTENAAAVALDTTVAVFDADLAALNAGVGNYSGASVTLSRNGGSSSDDAFTASGNLVFINNQAILSGTQIGSVFNTGGTLLVTFNANATQARVNEALSSISYANRSDAPAASVQIDWSFSDGSGTALGSNQGAGGALTTVGSTTVNITAINDAPTFAPATLGTGKVIVPVASGNDFGQSVTVQPDGKLVVAGYSVNGSNNDFSVIRLNADGSLDLSFGAGTGKAIVPVGSGTDQAYSITVQADGKLVVAGYSVNGSNQDFSVIRLNADGSLDLSFGAGTGKAIVPVGSGIDSGQSVTVQADGKLVVAGYSVNGSNDFSVIRLNADGSLDLSFGAGTGKAIVPVGTSNDFGQSVTVLPDGKLVVAGYSVKGSSNDFSAIRLNADGSLDLSFGAGTGKAIVPVGSGSDVGQSATVQPDGKLVVAGTSHNGIDFDFSVMRLNADGSLDLSFGAGTGKAIVPVGSGNDIGQSVTVQTDGKLVVAGYSVNGSNNYFSVVRLNADGSLDTSFGAGTGKAIMPVGTSNDVGQSVTVQPDGKLVVAGYSLNGSNYDFSVIRLNADGSLDTSFGAGAAVNTLGGTVTYTENAAAIALDASVAVFDAELSALNGGAGNYSGASATLARSGGGAAEDVFSGLGNLSLTAGNAVLSGTTVGTFTNANGLLAIVFNANATQVRVNETLSSIGYANTSDTPPASVQIAWSFGDGNVSAQGTGGALGTSGTTTVNITAVNDAPVFTGLDAAPTYTSGSPAIVLDANATVHDIELGSLAAGAGNYGGAVLTIARSGAADAGDVFTGSGNLTLTGGNVVLGGNTIGTDTNAGGSLAITFASGTTEAQVNDVLQKIAYSYTGVSFGTTATLSFSLSDGNISGQGSGGALSGSGSVAVSLVSGAPVVASGTPGADNLVGSSYSNTLNGLAGDDTLTGAAGPDRLNGGAGNDTMTGGNGDDVYVVDSAGDVVNEGSGAGSGIDTVESQLTTYTLGANLENLTYVGALSFTGTGNSANNTLTGGSSNDSLSGGDGNDILFGAAGLDTLNGGTGNDKLYGGLGNDVLIGGTGNDEYYFDTALSLTNVDRINDFSAADDTIYLDHNIFGAAGQAGQLSAAAFGTGSYATTAAQRIIFNPTDKTVSYDADGSGSGAAVRFVALLGTTGTITAADFWIY